MSQSVLVVEDDRPMADLIAEVLQGRGLSVRMVHTLEDALAALASRSFDLMVTDLNLGGPGTGEGLLLCKTAKELDAEMPTVVITAFGSLDTAIGAIRAGAFDFVTKPFEVESLLIATQRALRLRALSQEVASLRERIVDTRPIDGLVGESPAIRRLQTLLSRFSSSDANVLLRGESGTGKEIVARSIHARSHRASGPFVAVNVAATPASLLESELFGHTKGAFTGATDKRPGLFLAAHGGTLLLDEIGELPLELQPKLLRVLEDHMVRPLGSDREVRVDVRVIAATNRDLAAAVDRGEFRSDLYFRVAVLEVDLPPLRSRGRDILLLAQHFISMFAPKVGAGVHGLSPAAAQRLLDYSWPGNVRELRNCMERAVTLAGDREIGVADLPERVRSFQSSHVLVVAQDPAELVPLEVVEQRYIMRVLDAVSGNKSTAAKLLGLGRKTLYRKLERYGVTGGESSGEETSPPAESEDDDGSAAE